MEESDSLEQIRPEIVIDGQTFEVEERQAIVLPCLVDHLGMIDEDTSERNFDELFNFEF